jgi:heme exporter protein B
MHHELIAALHKDLLLQWRTRAHVVAVFVFGATALLLFSFGVGPVHALLRPHAAGFLWLALLLSSTLALSESFRTETEDRALEGLLLLPARAGTLYYGKAVANALQLTVLGVALLPVMVVLYDADPLRLPAVAVVVLLGAAGLSAPGTLYAAMAAQARAQQVLLPLLLFPLVVPVLLAAVKATSLVLLGDPMQQLRSWTGLLATFNVVYWTLCGALYRHVVDD